MRIDVSDFYGKINMWDSDSYMTRAETPTAFPTLKFGANANTEESVFVMPQKRNEHMFINGEEHKQCAKCKRWLPITSQYYIKSKSRWDGMCIYCNECRGFNFNKRTGFKICTKCNREFPSTKEYFHRHSGCRDGLNSVCKECRSRRVKFVKQAKNGYKICYKCNNEYPHTSKYFHKDSSHSTGLSSVCKKCRYAVIRKWVLKNSEHVKAFAENYRKKYYADNKLKIKNKHKEYRKNNKGKIKIEAQKRKAKIKNLLCDYSEAKWENCKKNFNNECAYCGKKTDLTQDHFIPLFKNGEYTINNVVPACINCNSSKNSNDFFEWYPKQKFYNKQRERKVLKYLNYDPKTKIQQLALC